MPLSRRSLLKRLPAAPFVVSAAVTQAPAMAKTLARTLLPQEQALPSEVPEISHAARLGWVRDALTYAPKPTLLMPSSGDALSINSFRAVVQWEMWEQAVAHAAEVNQVSLEEARRIAQEVLQLG